MRMKTGGDEGMGFFWSLVGVLAACLAVAVVFWALGKLDIREEAVRKGVARWTVKTFPNGYGKKVFEWIEPSGTVESPEAP